MKTILDKDEDNTVVQFKTITGGKGPGKNWLKECPEGTRFLTRPKRFDKPFLQEFIVYNNLGDAVELIDDTNKQELHVWVDSEQFSKDYEPFKFTWIIEE